MISATVEHDPQTSNGNQSQQQLQSSGWNGIPETTLVSRSIRKNGNSNGWNPIMSPFQHQQEQQLHVRK